VNQNLKCRAVNWKSPKILDVSPVQPDTDRWKLRRVKKYYLPTYVWFSREGNFNLWRNSALACGPHTSHVTEIAHYPPFPHNIVGTFIIKYLLYYFYKICMLFIYCSVSVPTCLLHSFSNFNHPLIWKL